MESLTDKTLEELEVMADERRNQMAEKKDELRLIVTEINERISKGFPYATTG